MPEAAARSRMASRGKASDSSKRGTYLSSIAAVRTDRSPCKLARTSCAGGNAAACPNLCTYLRATQCSPARTIILSTSPGPASPSTERHRAPHALRAPSYLQERERERRRRPGPETAAAHPPPPPARRFCASIACSSVVVGNSLRSWNSRANRSAAANCLPSTRRRTRAHVSNAGSRDQRRTCSHARRRPGPASAPPRPRSSLTHATRALAGGTSECCRLRRSNADAEGMTTIFGTA
mmetsp:Transcript_3293/g.10911  ORF Transcript_3293/g.10911 Transcript_3293/m.10911 type:complete len:237 (-) Transcript_3293:140-850(-)